MIKFEVHPRDGYHPIDIYNGHELIKSWVVEGGRSFKQAEAIARALNDAYSRGYQDAIKEMS